MLKFLTNVGLSSIFALSITLSIAPKANAEWQWIEYPGNWGEWIWNEIVNPVDPNANAGTYRGALQHTQFWNFCSKYGYQSYYDHETYIICGYNPYDPNAYAYRPQGVSFDYNSICEDIYGWEAKYNTSRKGCISQY